MKNVLDDHVAPNFEKKMLYWNTEMIFVHYGDLVKDQMEKIVEPMLSCII